MRNSYKYLLCLLFFVVLAAITFRCVFEPDHVFSASDLNYGRLALMKSNLPESLTGVFGANQIMGSSGYGYSSFKILLSALPLDFFANTFYGFCLVLGSISMIWFLRLWGRSWVASIFGALIAFWVNSITLAHVGHAYKLEVLVFSVLGLCFIEKGIREKSLRKAIGFSILAGLSVGIMMVEQQDVALLAGMFIGPYALFRLIQVGCRSVFRWVSILFPVVLVALLLSGSMVLKSYNRNIKGAASVQQDADKKWNDMTQWSMVPSEWPDLIAPGWGGWSTGNEKGPYWGKIGQSADWNPDLSSQQQSGLLQNFKLDSIYFGVVPFFMALFGGIIAFRSRNSESGKVILFWSVAAVLGLLLSFGRYSILYKLFYHLPMVNNIRAPIKLLDNVQICLAIVAAYGLDQLWIYCRERSPKAKMAWIAGFVVSGLALMAGLKYKISPHTQLNLFKEMGFPEKYADIMVQNMSSAWLHVAILMIVLSLLVFCAWKFRAFSVWLGSGFVLLMVVDSLMLTSHYFTTVDVSQIKKGNVAIDYLKENQGNERVYFITPSGPYAQWLASDGPYHGLNIYNVWQMPRMPVEYVKYRGTVERNLGTEGPEQFRVWQLSAVKYVTAPIGLLGQLQNPQYSKMFEPVLFYRFVPNGKELRVVGLEQPTQQQDQMILEVKETIPRFALYYGWNVVPEEQQCDVLIDANHDPMTTLLVAPDSNLKPQISSTAFQPVNDVVLTKKTATMTVNAEEDAVLRFAQRYMDGWDVFVDGGEPAELMRVDYLCMGVKVPKGRHTIEFRCVEGTGRTLFAGGVILFSIVSSIGLLVFRGRKPRS